MCFHANFLTYFLLNLAPEVLIYVDNRILLSRASTKRNLTLPYAYGSIQVRVGRHLLCLVPYKELTSITGQSVCNINCSYFKMKSFKEFRPQTSFVCFTRICTVNCFQFTHLCQRSCNLQMDFKFSEPNITKHLLGSDRMT
jgi:hypothetical protein